MNEEFLNHQDQTVQSLLQWDTSTTMLSLPTEVTSVPVPIDIVETLGAELGVTMRTKKASQKFALILILPPQLVGDQQTITDVLYIKYVIYLDLYNNY